MTKMSDTKAEVTFTCPSCGGQVGYDLTCHTWPQTRTDGSVGYMTCMPCDSAIRYTCVKCDWEYTDGLNKGNPRSKENELKRPTWLTDQSQSSFMNRTVMEGVSYYWDLDEDED